MSFHGHSLIAGVRSRGGGTTYQAISAITGEPLPGGFFLTDAAVIETAMAAAVRDFPAFRNADGKQRAMMLEQIADNLIALGDTLVERIQQETALTPARIHGERDRTVHQLRMYARIARENSWQDARIETADPDRQPTPKPDLRRLLVPIGPVVVFGASNFPLAYSVAGGDTASALATGNPVIVKVHEAHPGTSELVGEAIAAAIRSAGLPAGVFSMLHGDGPCTGIGLVKHPATRAVGFTGSYAAGRALCDAAAQRPDPIPVFAEMSGLNPIILLPGALNARPLETARLIAGAITQGMGQFCTKPGLLLAIACPGAAIFQQALAEEIAQVAPAPMLHGGIAAAYHDGCARAAADSAVRSLAVSAAVPSTGQAAAMLATTDLPSLLANAGLRHEVFGPFSLLVPLASSNQIEPVLRALGGQLTASVFGMPDEIHPALLDLLTEYAGRVVVNGVPTGVEVCDASQHGGPWPAASDARFTSVGPAACLRFVRPVAYQGTPDALLPAALQDANPLGIPRRINGTLTTGKIG